MEQPDKLDIIRLFGDMNDLRVVQILETGANLEQLEEVAAWLGGEDDVMADARIPLVGPAALVYDILIRDQEPESRIEPGR